MFNPVPALSPVASSSSHPFVIELRQEDRQGNGSFRPAASLKLTATLRTSGLLHALPPEEVKSLLFLLTFLSPNGECRAHLPHLQHAMQTSAGKAQSRMQRLSSFQWQGQPLAREMRHESGLVSYSYSLSPHLVSYEHLQPPQPDTAPPIRASSRDAVIAHSRVTYSRPRAEVERMIARDMEWDVPELREEATPEERERLELKRKLENTGVSREQIEALMMGYERERIERQLAWLPYRNAKNPAAYLVAAIEKDYDEPLALKHRRAALQDAEGSDAADSNNASSGNASQESVPEGDLIQPEAAAISGVPAIPQAAAIGETPHE